MPIYQMTSDMVEQLRNNLKEKENEYDNITNKTIENMWLDDLNVLDKSIDIHLLKSLSVVDEVVNKKKLQGGGRKNS